MGIGFLVAFVGLFHSCRSARTVSPERSLVFGPGLDVDIVLPVRYVYVQAVDKKGRNFTDSPGENTFTLDVHGSGGSRIRAMREVLDRSDGSYLLRFRLLVSCDDLEIHVKHKGVHVAKSPYLLKGPIYHEQCYCPVSDQEGWAEKFSCSPEYLQINKDFASFPQVDLSLIRGQLPQAMQNAMVHYTILRNKIYRKLIGGTTDFSMFTDEWFLSLARKVELPDVELLFNLGDWPKSFRGDKPIPVVSWCGSTSSLDIILPTYHMTKAALHDISRESVTMQAVQGNTGPRWTSKVQKLFFRGRDSSQERLSLAEMAMNNTDLFDVGITHYFFFKHDEKKYGPKAKHVSFFDFFRYKYQINMDGTVAAYRFPFLLVGDAVVFKQDSEYYEHFYAEIEPWKHFIPVKRDLSDLEERLSWARKNDKKAREIATSAQVYARDNLGTDQLYCYTLRVLQEYAKRQLQKPAIHEGMTLVEQPTGKDAECSCKRKKKQKEAKKRNSKAIDEL